MAALDNTNVMCPTCKTGHYIEDPPVFYVECSECIKKIHPEYISVKDQNIIDGFKDVETLLKRFYNDNTIVIKYSLEDFEAYVEDNKFGMTDMFSQESVR